MDYPGKLQFSTITPTGRPPSRESTINEPTSYECPKMLSARNFSFHRRKNHFLDFFELVQGFMHSINLIITFVLPLSLQIVIERGLPHVLDSLDRPAFPRKPQRLLVGLSKWCVHRPPPPTRRPGSLLLDSGWGDSWIIASKRLLCQ